MTTLPITPPLSNYLGNTTEVITRVKRKSKVEIKIRLHPPHRFAADAQHTGGIKFRMSQQVDLRLQIRNPERDRMIQIQGGRLHYNWLGAGGTQYPSYPVVKHEFDEVRQSFSRFLADESLGDFRANQWEVTYVNHIELILTLTARGPVGDNDAGDGLDLGRATIVKTFKELTSEQAWKQWGLIYE